MFYLSKDGLKYLIDKFKKVFITKEEAIKLNNTISVKEINITRQATNWQEDTETTASTGMTYFELDIKNIPIDKIKLLYLTPTDYANSNLIERYGIMLDRLDKNRNSLVFKCYKSVPLEEINLKVVAIW